MASRTQTYQYDTLDHLRYATSGIAVEKYTYDADGNRRTARWDTATATYNYPTSSNRLQGITGDHAATYLYSDNGSIRNDGSYSYTYNDGGRLTTATRLSTSAVTSYYYNGFGERIVKTGDGSVGSWAYVYDTAGHLLGEYSLDGTFQEHLWLGDIPIGNLRSGSTTPLYVLADHLNTPRMLINGATSPGTAVWGWQGDPFSSKPATASPGLVYNLRFPGQYYDAETKKHYNYFRDYDPAIGRYLESDPIGLAGGINTYGYVGGNPISSADPEGLWPTMMPGKSQAATQLPKTIKKIFPCLNDTEITLLAADAIDELNWADVKAVKAVTPNITNVPPPSNYNQLNPAQQKLLTEFLRRLPPRSQPAAQKCPCKE